MRAFGLIILIAIFSFTNGQKWRYRYNPALSKLYAYYQAKESLTYREAQKLCNRNKFNLITIDTPEEMAFIKRELVSQQDFWLGTRPLNTAGKSTVSEEWHDGRPITWSNYSIGAGTKGTNIVSYYDGSQRLWYVKGATETLKAGSFLVCELAPQLSIMNVVKRITDDSDDCKKELLQLEATLKPRFNVDFMNRTSEKLEALISAIRENLFDSNQLNTAIAWLYDFLSIDQSGVREVIGELADLTRTINAEKLDEYNEFKDELIKATTKQLEDLTKAEENRISFNLKEALRLVIKSQDDQINEMLNDEHQKLVKEMVDFINGVDDIWRTKMTGQRDQISKLVNGQIGEITGRIKELMKNTKEKIPVHYEGLRKKIDEITKLIDNQLVKQNDDKFKKQGLDGIAKNLSKEKGKLIDEIKEQNEKIRVADELSKIANERKIRVANKLSESAIEMSKDLNELNKKLDSITSNPEELPELIRSKLTWQDIKELVQGKLKLTTDRIQQWEGSMSLSTQESSIRTVISNLDDALNEFGEIEMVNNAPKLSEVIEEIIRKAYAADRS